MKILRIIEKLLAFLIILVVVWGIVMLLIAAKWGEVPPSPAVLHKTLEVALSDILLLVVAVELAMMLIYRRIEYLIDIMLFVVARKMLIGVTGVTEILGGVTALAALFAVRKYLIMCPGCDLVKFHDDSKTDK